MKLFKKLLNTLKLKEERIFLGSLEDWENNLHKMHDLMYTKIGSNDYVFMPILSVGTMRLNNNYLPIGIRLKVTVTNEEKLHLQFSGPVRPEPFFIMAFFLVMLIIVLCTIGLSTFFFILLGLWPLSQLLFHFVIRAQEESVVETLTKKTRLYKVRKETPIH